MIGSVSGDSGVREKVAFRMNLTLSLLSLTSLNTSPFISNSQTAASRRFLFQGVKMHGSFSAFSYNTLNARYVQSDFRRFLSSAIQVESASVQNLFVQIPLIYGFEPEVSVSDCFFQADTMGSGAGINMLQAGGTLNVVRCGFVRCSAFERGGAISFYGNILDIQNSCFHRCTCRDSGLAIESVNMGSNGLTKFDHMCVVMCSDPGSMDDFQQNSIYMIYGRQMGRNVNSSDCDAYFGGAFLGSEEALSFDFQLCNVLRPYGDNVMNLEDLAPGKSTLAYINLLDIARSPMDQRITTSIFRLERTDITLERSSIFVKDIMYVSEKGNLHLWWCTTNLRKDITSLNGVFTHRFTSFESSSTSTVDIKIKTQHCYKAGRDSNGEVLKSTPVQNEPDIPQLTGPSHPGIVTFIIFCAISSLVVFAYYFYSSRRERDISVLEDVQYTTL